MAEGKGKTRIRGSAKKDLSKKDKLKKVIRKEIVKFDNRTKELKYYLGYISYTRFGYSPSPTCISTIAQGDTDNLRDGRRIFPTSLNLNWDSYSDSTTGAMVRVIVFRWLSDNSTYTPASGMLLNDSGTARHVLSPYATEYRNQYNILYDKVVKLGYINAGATRQGDMITIPLKKSIDYVGTSTAGKNQIYVMVVSDLIAASGPYVGMWYQLNYTD